MSFSSLKMPPATFPLNLLPKELRLQIWTEALPGPRIVYIQRHLYTGESPLSRWGRFPIIPYFGSPTPCVFVIALLGACRESSDVVKKHYAPLFGPAPSPLVWFNYANDYLFADWGGNSETLRYLPKHFKGKTPEEDSLYDRWGAPHIDGTMAEKVKNLVVCNYLPGRWYTHCSEEEFLVEHILQFFSGAQVVVLADKLFNQEQAKEELAWLIGNTDFDARVRFHDDTGAPGINSEEPIPDQEVAWACARRSILWRDPRQNLFCQRISLRDFQMEWEKLSTKNVPKVFKNSIVSAKMKREMLRVFGSEPNFKDLKRIAWHEVEEGADVISEDIEISKQIAILELALMSTITEITDYEGFTSNEGREHDVQFLLARIDTLRAVLDQRGVLLAKAEVML